ncbi:restriction endonuclease subunit S [Photobacterium phosphoreum]|uniref:restriction endonuclease subunit S n=1 Tax=Photobacterium phosphoreum TaxID=659 RepID=UPI0024B82AD9|nr:restriction endonuclease subunit S [Photobacterium phosphoreum]
MSCNSLGDLLAKGYIKIFTGPFGSALHKHEYIEEGVRVIPAEAIFSDGLNSTTFNHITLEKAQVLKRYRLQKGDIVFARRGAQACGRSALVGDKEEGSIAGTGLIYLRVLKKDLVVPEYLHLAVSSAKSLAWLKAHAIGATMPNLNNSVLCSLPLNLPSNEKQVEVVNGYYPIIKKIRVNTKLNQTLEQMAQAIFKSWFVDFDPVKAKMNGEQPEGMDAATASLFPEKLVESEFGLIPEGWNIESIKDFGDVICGKTPSKKNAAFYAGDVPFIKIPDTHGKVFITETSDTLTQAGDESQPKKRIPENSICVSCIATVGQVFITTKPSHTNQQINSVVPYDQNSLYYLLFKFKGLNKHFHDLASGGSATLNMNTSTFSKVALVRPTSDVLEAFHKTVGGLMEKMLANQLENATLSELRDTLLPKLLSGEIELGNAEESLND